MTDTADLTASADSPSTGVWRRVRLVAVTVVGAFLVVAGLAMIVLPGPGLLVLIAGLAVLATEYAWARRHLDRAKRAAQKAKDKVAGHSKSGPGAPPS